MAKKRCAVLLEPALFLFMLAYDMKKNALMDLIYSRTCQGSFTDQVCANLKDEGNQEAFAEVQAMSSFWIFMTQVFLGVPGLFTCLYMGSWSDHTNRKLPLIVSSLGEIFSTLLLVLLANTNNASLWVAAISCGVSGLGGNFIVTIYGIVSYMTDISSEESRTIRMSILEGMAGAGAIVGPMASAVVIEMTGHKYVYLVVLGLFVTQFIYVIYAVQSRKPECPVVKYGEEGCCSDLLRPFRDMWQTLTKEREGRGRTYIALDAFIFMSAIIASFGYFDILYLFVKDEPLEWSYTTYSTFVSIIFVGRTTGALILFPLFRRITGASDPTVIAVGIFFKMLSMIMLGFTTNVAIGFAVAATNGFFSFIMAGCKSLLSKLVQQDERGKIFSVLASLDNIAVLVASLIFNTLYPLTRAIFNGLLFECMAVMLVPSFIIACGMSVLHKPRQYTEEVNEFHPLLKSTSSSQKIGQVHETDL